MASVDNRIVRMEFDNAAFERKLQQTLASLSGLDKALKMTGATKGLTDVQAAAKKVDLSPVADGANRISTSFSAMSAVAVTALATITHAAITSGARMVQALSMKPILDGFAEYELNMGSIQTILANTRADGTNLEQVNKALDQLNEYSDKTIYNFGQMTRNIGTFTAAGVDLETSVMSIKGISNLAAISGSSAEQAAGAMYQLSQAVSTGTLRLIDWNSVVNAGMGGEVFQKALFETGVAMGTITDAPVGTTFEEWTAAGNNFRDSLQEGWLTGEVLTNTLKGFTGEMTEAQLLSIGYTKEQAAEILALGQSGVEAATKIRTLSQLMNTVKETIASGWSESFRTVFGNFEEATVLFTKVNDAVGGFVKRQTEARNELLNGWKELGGRDVLIKGIGDAFKALGEVLRPIKEAFRSIFPPQTAESLFRLTEGFARFTAALRPSEQTIENIKRIFTGLFSVLSIGWTVIKEGAGFLKDLVVQVTGLGSGKITEFTADISDFFTRLQDGLVKGEGIKRFFDNMSAAIPPVIRFFKDLKDTFLGLFDGFDFDKSDAAGEAAERMGDRFGALPAIFDRIAGMWKPFKEFADKVGDILDRVGELIGNWFQDLGAKLADAMGPGEFDAVLDALNVSLLGGIALLLTKFLTGGINLDFGGGLLDGIRQSFEQLTDTLGAMQTQIKADALLRIAGAVALLTASVVALSLIDSAALTRALVAMAVGFGQLMASFAIISLMDVGLVSGTTFTIIANGMIAMSAAILILSGAVAVMGKMDPEELARGLGGIAAAITLLTTASIILSKNSGSILLASISLSAIAGSLLVLSTAVLAFGQMEWDTLIKGFAGVAAGLVIIAGAMHLMPPNMLATGAALILISTGLSILAGAVALFAMMEWDTMAKGFAGVGAGLLIIAGAMHLMPPNMLVTAAALIGVSVALNILAKALEAMGEMKGGDIAKAIGAMAGALIVLAVGMHAMQGALVGAAAMVVVSVAMGILAKVLQELAKIPTGDLVKGLVTIAAALTVFGIAAALMAPVVPALLGLSVAMLALGGAFALFGVGALAAAKAFEIIAKVGPEAAEAIQAALEAFGKALPTIIQGFAEGLLELIQTFADAAGPIAEAVGVIFEKILDTMIKLTPKFGELMGVLIDVMIFMVNEKSPALIDAGILLLLTFLEAIRENVYQMTDLVGQIMEAFLLAVGANAQAVTDAGASVIIAFLAGVGQNMGRVVSAVGNIIAEFINGIGNAGGRFVSAGADVIVKLVNGVSSQAQRVISAGTNMATNFISGVGNSAGRIVSAGADAIIKFASGLSQNVQRVVQQGVAIVIQFINGISASAYLLAIAASNAIINFLNALAGAIRSQSGALRAAGLNVAAAIIDGITGGILSKAQSVANQAVAVAKKAIDAVKGFLGINSPSKVFMVIGGQMAEGMAVGLEQDDTAEKSAVSLAQRTTKAINDSLNEAMLAVSETEEFSPSVTPVLDLTRLRNGARDIANMVGDDRSLTPDISYRNANVIATTAVPYDQDSSGGNSGPTEIKFEQNIHAPTQLSTGEIYRNTRNQITLAKEELDVA